LSTLFKIGNYKNKKKHIDHALCNSIERVERLPNFRSSGEDEQDERLESEVEEEDDLELVVCKKWKIEQK
jgi:hypothetical protein